MKKIKLKQVVKQIYKQELENFLVPESWYDCCEKEKAEAIKEFKEDWKEIETIEDLLGTLCALGYDDSDAADMVLQAVIEE